MNSHKRPCWRCGNILTPTSFRCCLRHCPRPSSPRRALGRPQRRRRWHLMTRPVSQAWWWLHLTRRGRFFVVLLATPLPLRSYSLMLDIRPRLSPHGHLLKGPVPCRRSYVTAVVDVGRNRGRRELVCTVESLTNKKVPQSPYT